MRKARTRYSLRWKIIRDVTTTIDKPLSGRGIVITRPAVEAQRLAELVRAAGGNPFLYPAIEILDAADLRSFDNLIERLDQFDLAIFISPNAVTKAMTRIRARRTLPAHLKVAAIGRGGVRALQSFGVREVIAPGALAGRYDSETLLAEPALRDVDGKRVVIFRGEGGRELLGDTLSARGAIVEYAQCYRRGKPSADPAPLLEAWAHKRISATIFTSSEGLRNFYQVIGEAGQAELRNTPVFVPHPRVAATARELGLTQVVESASGDEALAAALLKHFAAG